MITINCIGRYLALWITLAPVVATANPAENAVARQKQVVAYLKRSAAEVTSNALASVNSFESWTAIREEKRREYLYMLGLNPMPERTPIEAEVSGLIETPTYRVEKIVFQSSPKLYVTGNFYIPSDASTPLPTILYVCGHSPHPLGAKYHYQDRAQWFAENGYACLIIDTLEFGEVAGIHHGLHNLNMWRWLSTGYTPAGVEVWNAMRAIDFLETRKEVDTTRIGITGISGGGAVSWYAAAADERIAVAVPVCGTFTFGSQAANWLADGQCDCIYFNNTFQADLSIVGALIAPRPLMMCSGMKDSIFPPDGYHEVYRQTKRVYDFHAAEVGEADQRIREVDDNVPHQDSPKLRQATRQWFNLWLKEDPSPVELVPNPTEKRHSAKDLACLSDVPWDAANFGVHDQFVALAKPPNVESLPTWTARRQHLLAELKDKSFRWFPSEEIAFAPVPNGGHGGWLDRYGDYDDFQIQSEEGVHIRVQLVKARKRSPNTPLLIYIKRPEDNLSFVDVDELLPVLGHCDLAILNPRLTDHPIESQERTNIERTAAWSGRTIAAMQVWDIHRAIQWLTDQLPLANRRVVLFAKSEMAVPALYAAVLNPTTSQLIVRDLPPSHQQAPPILNALRITDIPEVAAAFAPKRLTFLGNRPAGFEWIERVYALHKKPHGLSEAASLAEALFDQ